MDFILLGYNFTIGNITYPLNASPGLRANLTLNDLELRQEDMRRSTDQRQSVMSVFATTESSS